jgi:amidohydrolase
MHRESLERAREWRRQLHRIPGTGFDVGRAGDFIADVCTTLGWEITRGIGGTGLVATLRSGTGTSVIGLRSDMDGLPLAEDTGRAHASTVPGIMHACGHDGHMAMLLGTAAQLAEEPDFEGTVHLVFQPAEEPGTGAQAMIDDGLFERFPMDAMYGLHNIPGLPTGEVHVRSGAIMAAEDNFVIEITGRGGHASAPHLVIDPIVIGAEVILALQTITARDIDPLHAVVVSCTELTTDGVRNAIPGQLTIRGDARTFSDEDSRIVEQRIREISDGIAQAHRAGCEVAYSRSFRPTVNDPNCTDLLARAASDALGDDRVLTDCAPVTASEDFAAYARRLPACFAFLGVGTDATPLHSRLYDFNDDALAAGIDLYRSIIRSALPRKATS